jgi:hypothetical protein
VRQKFLGQKLFNSKMQYKKLQAKLLYKKAEQKILVKLSPGRFTAVDWWK